jgi:hypothetical protein
MTTTLVRATHLFVLVPENVMFIDGPMIFLIGLLSVVLFFPWTTFFYPSGDFVAIDSNFVYPVVVFSSLMSFSVIFFEIFFTTVQIYASGKLMITQRSKNYDSEALVKELRKEHVITVKIGVQEEHIRDRIINEIFASNSDGEIALKLCSDFLKIQGYIYFFDFASSLTVIFYLLYNKLKYSLVTIQLTTMGLVPSALSITFVKSRRTISLRLT